MYSYNTECSMYTLEYNTIQAARTIIQYNSGCTHNSTIQFSVYAQQYNTSQGVCTQFNTIHGALHNTIKDNSITDVHTTIQ